VTLAKNDVLPDRPGEYGAVLPDGYRQRWMPGAFGDRETIEDVDGFKVIRDEWVEQPDGLILRTILEAEAL
jgi:hypothetical protein